MACVSMGRRGKGEGNVSLVFNESDFPTGYVKPLLFRLSKELTFVEGEFGIVDERIVGVVF